MLNKYYIIIGLVLFLSGCSSKEPGRYYNDKYDFSIKFPKGWENKDDFMGTAVISLSPKENASDTFRENVNVAIENIPDGMSLNGYFYANIPKLSKIIRDFHEDETGATTIDNNESEWLIYTGSIGTINMKAKQFYVIHGKKGYVITCSATPETYDSYKSTFEEVARSFKFE